MKKVLTIAGSDCSGGAGIQADIKTIAAHRMYAMSAITALTAQNTTGVFGILEAPPEFVEQQLDCIFEDIRPDAVKIGMVSNARIIEAIGKKLAEYGAENIVVDPVMVATSGGKLLVDDAVSFMIESLLPLASVITPNVPESEALAGMTVADEDGMQKAALLISKLTGGSVLIKGGHLSENADDLLLAGGEFHWFRADRVQNPNTHGTGCTLSSAIACNLAAGLPLEVSVQKAKDYVTGALNAGLNLGHGRGPLDHMYGIGIEI